MAAAVLLRSMARKMSGAAAAAAQTHHRSLVARGLHGGARLGLANSNQVQEGTAVILMSAGIAAASGLRFGAGRRTTKMAHAPLPPPPPPPPPPYHLLVHGRGIHNRTSPDPIPSTPKKINQGMNAAAGVAFIALLGFTICMHFWVQPALDEVTAKVRDFRKKKAQLSQNMHASSVSHQTPTAPASAGLGNKTEKGTWAIVKLGKEEAVKMHSQENYVKELETTIMDLQAETAELKTALDSCRSQGKV